jgi:hypothetical protein
VVRPLLPHVSFRAGLDVSIEWLKKVVGEVKDMATIGDRWIQDEVRTDVCEDRVRLEVSKQVVGEFDTDRSSLMYEHMLDVGILVVWIVSNGQDRCVVVDENVADAIGEGKLLPMTWRNLVLSRLLQEAPSAEDALLGEGWVKRGCLHP